MFNGVDRIDFEDADSTLHFFFPEDVAYTLADSANRINVTRVFSSQRGKDYVLVGVPFSWIDAAPKGTLIIDPTVQPVANADVYLYDASNHNSAPDGLSLLVGKFAGTNKKRTVIKFPMTSIPANATVLNAQMKLRYFGNGGSTWVDRWVQAHRVLVDWNETQATRDARLTSPSYTAWKATYGKIGPGNNPSNEDADGQYESRILFWQNETLPTWKSWDLTALTQKWVNGSASNYGVILWATNEDTDGKDLQFRSTSYTAGERPYLEVIYYQYAKTVYFLKDHLGSIRATVWDTANAPVVGHDDYDAWGFPLAGRSLANSVLPAATRNRFTGKERDDEFGVNWDYFGARYYDSQIGRWMSVDPLAEKHPDFTPYNYVLNNPLRLIDPDGRQVIYSSLYKAPPTSAEIKQNLRQSYEESRTFASAGLMDLAVGRLALGLLEAVGGVFENIDPGGISGLVNPIMASGALVEHGVSLADDAAKLVSAGDKITNTVQTLNKAENVVIGHFPEYLKAANELGASRFSISSEIWHKMSDAEKWIANKTFLDQAINKGAKFSLATPITNVKRGSWLRREIDYLLEMGYQLSDDGTTLTKIN